MLAQPTTTYLTIAGTSYVLGSIPFGLILVRLFRGEDVRASGSGNIGATNVARSSPVLGVATLILDAGKGLAAVAIARTVTATVDYTLLATVAALCAVLGHIFPVWLKFRGGKGVATSLGSFLLVAPKSIVCVIGLFAIIVAITRYVSLGSVVAAAALPLVVLLLHDYSDPRQLLIILFATLLILIKHRQNISRLVSKSEPKLGASHG